MKKHFEVGDRVTYMPRHTGGNIDHPDVECGMVSAANELWVFVRFDSEVARLGWDGTTSRACCPKQLAHIRQELSEESK